MYIYIYLFFFDVTEPFKHKPFRTCPEHLQISSESLQLWGAMPLTFQKETQDFRYLFFVNESDGRYMVMLISGVCTMTECLSFVSAYPVDMITPNVQHRIPRGDMYFQHEVTIKVKCYNQPGQTMPDWLKYLAEQFGGKLRFTDAYTFHLAKHFLMANWPGPW